MAITISGTTGVAGVDGSASAPSVVGTDSNSGVYFGADVIKFSTGGTERMSITNTGFTGITTGKVLQVVQSTSTEEESQAGGGTGTYYDIAGTDQAGSGSVFCVKITPSATSSKILFTSNLGVGGATVWAFKMYRDSTALNIHDTVTNKESGTFNGKGSSAGVGVGFYSPVTITYSYLDSPSSTSELTYKVKWGRSHTGNLYLNRSQDDSSVYRFRSASSLIVMEVGA